MQTGVTIGFANVSPNVTFTLNVSDGNGGALSVPRSEYHLTPQGSPESKVLQLNGAVLTYGGPGQLDPALPTVVTDPTTPLTIGPLSVGYIVFTQVTNLCTR